MNVAAMVTELGMMPVVEDLGGSSEKVTETCIGHI